MTLKSATAYYQVLHDSYGRKNFKSKLKMPDIEEHEGRRVLRTDLSGGFKAHAAEKFIAHIGKKGSTLVYCAPRTGHAALAIAKLAKMYGKKCVFFAPSSKECTKDQACVLNYGHELRFLRIAAMPNLNRAAKQWADDNGAIFLPFGLANTPEITAGIVNLFQDLQMRYRLPKEIWCATSTGTMIRGMEIAMPGSTMRTVAVARNMQPGEISDRVDIVSSEVPFLTKCKTQPPFPTTAHYDAKAWERCVNEGKRGSLFINVGSDEMVEKAAKGIDLSSIDSAREWGDDRDLRR